MMDVAAGVVGLLIIGTLAISAAVGTSSAVATDTVAPAEAAAVAGAVILLLVAAALGSGSRGGPLALEAPLVFLVLMAPLDRGLVLRQPAVRQLLVGVAAGAAIAGIAALAATPRLFDPRLGNWVIAGCLGGALIVGLSLVAAGIRLQPGFWLATQAAIGLWWLGDLAIGVATSPVAALAQLPFRPLTVGGLAYPVCITALAVGVGVVRVGRVSLEKAWRRSHSADQLRVAVGLNDLRTALLILRRRSGEQARSKPWLKVTVLPRIGGTVSRRGVQSIVRWPARLVGRFVLLAVVVGLLTPLAPAAPAVWLVVIVALYLAGLEAIDPLAEELDHPDLARLYPVGPGALLRRHLAVPIVTVSWFNAIAVAAAWASTSRTDVALLGIGLIVPTALATVAGAALTASRGARPLTRYTDIGLPAEVVAPRIVLTFASPLLPIAVTAIPTVAAFANGAGVGSALVTAFLGVLASGATIVRSTRALGTASTEPLCEDGSRWRGKALQHGHRVGRPFGRGLGPGADPRPPA